MVYLKKNNQLAIDFVSNFVKINWLIQDDGSFKYQNIGYANIKNPATKFRGFFVSEQDGYCCYCCRNIVNDHTTELEHIIPRSKITEVEFEEYYQYSNILKENVVPQYFFEISKIKLDTPPFPHHIAYHNIVASCNGKFLEGGENFSCCNRERKDDSIPPFNLMNDCILYLSDGTIVYREDLIDENKFIEKLNLNKEILNRIRRLWFLFSISNLDLQEILSDTSKFSIEEKIVGFAIEKSEDILSDLEFVKTFFNLNFWNIFKNYSFFFEYYKNNR